MNALAVWMLLAVATIDDATPTSAPTVDAAESTVEGTVEPAPAAPPTTAPATTPPPPATPPVTVRALPSSWAPPTTGDASGLFVAAQIFTGFEAPMSPVQQTTWPRFVVDRVEFGGGVVHQRVLQAVVRLEAIRSASAQSAFGIDVNSLLPRFRLAYGAVTHTTSLLGVDVDVVLRAGLIPEPWPERAGFGRVQRAVSPNKRASWAGVLQGRPLKRRPVRPIRESAAVARRRGRHRRSAVLRQRHRRRRRTPRRPWRPRRGRRPRPRLFVSTFWPDASTFVFG